MELIQIIATQQIPTYTKGGYTFLSIQNKGASTSSVKARYTPIKSAGWTLQLDIIEIFKF